MLRDLDTSLPCGKHASDQDGTKIVPSAASSTDMSRFDSCAQEKSTPERQALFSIDTHWNELGHKVIVAEIYQFLLGRRLL